MNYLKGIAILSLTLLFAMAGSMARGAVKGPQLELIADEASLVNGSWKNRGVAGGVIPGGAAPVFEPAEGKNPARFTAKRGSQIFGGPAGANPTLHLEDFTVEVILKRNGPAYGDEHQVAGFHSVDGGGWFTEQSQWIMLGFYTVNGGAMWMYLKGAKTPLANRVAYGVMDIGVGKWHHILFTYKDKGGRGGNQLQPWMDGEKEKAIKTVHDFVKDVNMNYHAIFCQVRSEARRNFNGSIHLVRVYDRVLSDAEIRNNFKNPEAAAVEPASKLAITWGSVKTQY